MTDNRIIKVYTDEGTTERVGADADSHIKKLPLVRNSGDLVSEVTRKLKKHKKKD